MSAAAVEKPVMLWIPPRTKSFLACWVAVSHVVSIYYINHTVFIELDTKRTLVIQYAEEVEGADMAKRFVDAMSTTPTDTADWPLPIGGDIRRSA